MRVAVTDLVGRPGAVRGWSGRLTPGAEVHEAVADRVLLDLSLESVVEGILVRGVVEADVVQACARCLDPVAERRRVTVAELFVDPHRADADEADEGYELVDDNTAIELDTMVRDAVVMDLPVRTLCRPECAGLCPVCGDNRNDGDCGHRPAALRDPRWAALAELDLPPA